MDGDKKTANHHPNFIPVNPRSSPAKSVFFLFSMCVYWQRKGPTNRALSLAVTCTQKLYRNWAPTILMAAFMLPVRLPRVTLSPAAVRLTLPSPTKMRV